MNFCLGVIELSDLDGEFADPCRGNENDDDCNDFCSVFKDCSIRLESSFW